MDSSKHSFADFRHRAAYHHAEGIALGVQLHGPTVTTISGKQIPVRYVLEQHVQEDLGHIPNRADWLRCLKPEAWMMRGNKKLHEEVTAYESQIDANAAGQG